MPREWMETVLENPKPQRRRVYLVEVKDVRKNKEPHGVFVELVFLDWDQFGCMHSEVLPLPIRNDGITALFLRACGLEIKAGCKVNPKKVIGTKLGARFTIKSECTKWTIIGFERTEENHEPTPESESATHSKPEIAEISPRHRENGR